MLSLKSDELNGLVLLGLYLYRFGEGVEVLHPLESPFSANQGGHLLCNLTFTQKKTNFVQVETAQVHSMIPCMFNYGS